MSKEVVYMTNKPERNLQPYEKPALRVIELAAEEVLASGCKTISGGPSKMPLRCAAGSCFQNGS